MAVVGQWLKPNTAAESSLVSALLGWEKTQTLNMVLILVCWTIVLI